MPIPRNVAFSSGCFQISDITLIQTDPSNVKNGKMLANLLKLSDSNVVDSGSSSVGGISLELSPNPKLGPEGYELEVTESGIVIRGPTEAGIFHAIMTLRQLLPPAFEKDDASSGPAVLPLVAIKDWPVYSWRGMHLDVSRHFFDAAYVKKFIDILALHKMNRFHWHLTDDQGWRIPIRKYPKLTQVGAFRTESSRDSPVGGFYTHEEIADIVQFAADRYITVVPEIEMPGHAQAAIASYPELGCPNHNTPKVWTDWGVSHEAFCAGNPKSYEFLEDVLREVMELFPSVYIHVGGDECDKDHWRGCSLCQQEMDHNHLHSPEELQAHFTSRMSRFLAANGRRLVGWDEILEGGLDNGATVMSWRGVDGGVEAARRGLDAVMAPQDFVYFDRSYYHGDRLGRFGVLSVRTTYDWEPVPGYMEPETKKHILGGQGTVWTEGITTPSEVEYLSLPRIPALAEVLWSPAEVRGWDGFCGRLNSLQQHYTALGMDFYRDPDVERAHSRSLDLERQVDEVDMVNHPNVSLEHAGKIENVLNRNTHWYSKMFSKSGMPK